METIEPSAILHGAMGVLLILAGWLDLRRRELPILLPLLILAAGALLFLLSFPSPVVDEVYLATALVGATACCAFLAGWLGPADVVVVVALVLVVLSLEGERQVEAMQLAAAGTFAGLLLWYFARAVRSVRISGMPKNSWDLLALTKGRLDAEPHLERFQTKKKKKSALLLHLEAFRTPDGSHLGHDPCPLVSCLACGYLVMLGLFFF